LEFKSAACNDPATRFTAMQFDFIKRLFGSRERPAARAAKRMKFALQVAAQPEEPLLSAARRLLHAAGAAALALRVRIEWNDRMRSTAGVAFPSRALVRLNPRLREFGDEEIDRTLRHELAHLLAHERAGRRRIAPHGPEWRRACHDLGVPDEKRTHDLPLPRRVVSRRFHYRCPACGVRIARVKPLKRGSACLGCCRAHSQGRYDARFRFQPVKAGG
jgi:predicted SprT family Zn-dependent metalloprotease